MNSSLNCLAAAVGELEIAGDVLEAALNRSERYDPGKAKGPTEYVYMLEIQSIRNLICAAARLITPAVENLKCVGNEDWEEAKPSQAKESLQHIIDRYSADDEFLSRLLTKAIALDRVLTGRQEKEDVK